MATVVPVSHSQRWRSRSRNQSADAMMLQDPLRIHIHAADEQPQPQPQQQGAHDNEEQDEEDEEDEERDYDNVQTAPWLVVPQGFASPSQLRSTAPHALASAGPGSPLSTASWQKAMEMRRPTGF